MSANASVGGLAQIVGIFSSREDKYCGKSREDIVLHLEQIYRKCIEAVEEEEGFSSKRDYRSSSKLREEVDDRIYSLRKKNRKLARKWEKRFAKL